MPSPLEKELFALTKPINGQYPRPWMTNLRKHEKAKVFDIGANPATAYTKKHVKSHRQFMDIHFNRNGYDCQSFYAGVRAKEDKSPSPSRINIETLMKTLTDIGVLEIFETNVYCYSSPNFSHLTEPKHPGGKERGLAIFQTLIRCIHPKVLIIHGARVSKEFSNKIEAVPSFPMVNSKPVQTKELFKTKVQFNTHTSTVFVIPSLGAPGSGKWSLWAEDYLVKLAQSVRRHLR